MLSLMLGSQFADDVAPHPASEEFATEPVPPDRRVGWLGVGLISAMVAFSLTVRF